MLKITEVGHGMKAVEYDYENGKFGCCWENEKGHRWTSDFKYSYSPEHGFRSFTYNYTDYEYDEYTNRYYYRRGSIILRSEMDGVMVRERIGKAAYMEIYGQLLEHLGLNKKEETETIETTEICPECETEAEVKSGTYTAECPVCHGKPMFCGLCRETSGGSCDYDTATDTCRFDSS